MSPHSMKTGPGAGNAAFFAAGGQYQADHSGAKARSLLVNLESSRDLPRIKGDRIQAAKELKMSDGARAFGLKILAKPFERCL